MESIAKLKKLANSGEGNIKRVFNRLLDASIYQHIRESLNVDIGPNLITNEDWSFDEFVGESSIVDEVQKILTVSDLSEVVVDDKYIPWGIFANITNELEFWFHLETTEDENFDSDKYEKLNSGRDILLDKFLSTAGYEGIADSSRLVVERFKLYGIKFITWPKNYEIRYDVSLPLTFEGQTKMHNEILKERKQRESATYQMLPASEKAKIRKEKRSNFVFMAIATLFFLGIPALVIYWSETSKGGPVNSAESGYCSNLRSRGLTCTEQNLNAYRNVERSLK